MVKIHIFIQFYVSRYVSWLPYLDIVIRGVLLHSYQTRKDITDNE